MKELLEVVHRRRQQGNAMKELLEVVHRHKQQGYAKIANKVMQ